ncbi:SRPBCC family protein [Fulvivirga sp. RKSG066]|uniref:SRPBCC family protein n=1 Tax=Fulvivirga aurantia TaxID=2529383 RepID=UPI0012BCE0BA|nr:SRPBCC family protein [Fulvivirga aurantia]MTI19973.1 SRPBCC family protein [Fulvivirga aurantia]
MKYTLEIVIDLPREEVIALFDNPENLKKWQEGLVSFEHLSGERGKPGAKSKLFYRMGKREIEMIETITVRNLPEEFSGTYEADGVYNIQRNFFKEKGKDQTLWISESEFQFSGFMKLMGWVMPGAFKKQSKKFLVAFKEFAESKSPVANDKV